MLCISQLGRWAVKIALNILSDWQEHSGIWTRRPTTEVATRYTLLCQNN